MQPQPAERAAQLTAALCSQRRPRRDSEAPPAAPGDRPGRKHGYVFIQKLWFLLLLLLFLS